MRSSILALSILLTANSLAGQNSNRKIRAVPSELAAKAGSAVKWRKSLEAAMEESRASGKPLFWYLPTLVGSRMDRKPEVDRYMMAGPFSWPDVISVLNEHCVPLRHAPNKREQQRYAVAPGGFIEPGFLILDAEGEECVRIDKLSSFHPQWFLAQLDRALGIVRTVQVRATDPIWRAFGSGDAHQALDLARKLAERVESPADRAEVAYLLGAALFQTRREVAAIEVWQQLGRDLPSQPWTFKAMAEAEGHGPFVRGFEIYSDLPGEVMATLHAGSQAPPGTFEIDALWDRGARFLAQMQRSHGGFIDCRYDFGGTDSLPNVYVAVTAIAGQALWLASLREDTERVASPALDSVLDYLCDDSHLNTEDRDEIVWAHIYRARFFSHWLSVEKEHPKRAQVSVALRRITGGLIGMQPESGAWYHEYPNPFVIASVLVTLRAAEESGIDIPSEVVDRGVRALLACRASNGAYSYGYRPGRAEGTKIAAAAGRMPLAEYSLSLWGHGKEDALLNALQAAFTHHQHMEEVRKYDDHAGALGYGGFFFWYDMHARSEALMHLGGGEVRDRLIAKQRAIIMDLPEIDGCFVDSHELGRVYGTAMALICLRLLEG